MKNIHFKIDSNGFVTPEINNGIIENENNVTLLTAEFPEIYSDFEKYIIFRTRKPVEIIDGSKTRLPQLLMTGGKYILPSSIVNANILEVAFKAIKSDGTCFTTEKVSFIPFCETLSSDSLAPAPLPTGFAFKEGINIGISDSKSASLRSVEISLKSPLEQKLLLTDIAGLNTELIKKVEKSSGKSLVADTEIARLASVANYDDSAMKRHLEYTMQADFDPINTLGENNFMTLIGTEANPFDVNKILKNGYYILDGWFTNLPETFTTMLIG